ncbi:DUF2069 domain-containing protein [Undibacterium fentianense]|uniref:DUF2069 domain-containing protein n=1 Tax=Undibacterium fentianense TaxID=2828728 RepID=A0A941DZX4_9BURK|nr:DUF2069 domain-containing protein [Undibacterium fentianense]MBR7798712.1 DUF2069 domain-containing protein [Undibacterium fentianense]
MISQPSFLYRTSVASLISLIALCILWEVWLAPYKPGGSIFVLKVLPLLLPIRGILQKNIYTMQWSSMLIMFYFMEGVVRAMSDTDLISRYLAGAEITLSILFFISSIYYVRPFKILAKAAKKTAPEHISQ